MKKRISILALLMVVCASSAFASGWRIPEQSVNSTALSAAYVANASGADASYFNPANMVFDKETEKYQFEFDLNYIHLTSVEYEDNNSSTLDAESRKENFLIPLFHLVSPEYNNFRFGVSLTTPAGLSKRWKDGSWAEYSAREFSLEVFELNPTIAYKVTNWLSVGGGVRGIYSKGTVESEGAPAFGTTFNRKLKGDSIDFGYNLALSIKPVESVTTSLTWRSKVDLDLDGTSLRLWTDPSLGHPADPYTEYGEVSVPLPEVLTIAVAYTIKATTFEITWDRTYWSDYSELDFNYGTSIPWYLEAAFGTPRDKSFDDSDAFRFGLTHNMMDNKLTLMFGFAIDETPVPEATLGFELPDSDAKIYSCGFRYKLDETYEVGMSFLYDQKEERKVSDNDSNLDGEFTNSSAYMVTTGIMAKF